MARQHQAQLGAQIARIDRRRVAAARLGHRNGPQAQLQAWPGLRPIPTDARRQRRDTCGYTYFGPKHRGRGFADRGSPATQTAAALFGANQQYRDRRNPTTPRQRCDEMTVQSGPARVPSRSDPPASALGFFSDDQLRNRARPGFQQRFPPPRHRSASAPVPLPASAAARLTQRRLQVAGIDRNSAPPQLNCAGRLR